MEPTGSTVEDVANVVPTKYWHVLDDKRIQCDHGCCKECGAACAGVFEASPGAWGPRHKPVNMRDWAAKRPVGERVPSVAH